MIGVSATISGLYTNTVALLVQMPMNRRALLLPAPDGALVAFQIGGDLFPGIETFAGLWPPRLGERRRVNCGHGYLLGSGDGILARVSMSVEALASRAADKRI
jgi:hypothetical protein